MTKLESIPPSLAYPTTSHFDRGPTNRLIVLFPPSARDRSDQSRRIWEIAGASGSNVLLIGLYVDPCEEPQLRRTLITMAASIKDINISTEFMIQRGNDWVECVKSVYRPGDVIACYAGQRVGPMRRSLHKVLVSQLEAPIYILSEEKPIKNSWSKSLLQASFWLGSLAIIGGFFWVEAKIIELPQDWVHTLLLSICVMVEIGLIWLWNSIFTQSP